MKEASATMPDTPAELVPNAASNWPELPALVDADFDLSWSEVDTVVRKICHILAGQVVPGRHVLLAAPKSVPSWLVIHGLLRLGAVVVPVDSMAPAATNLAIADECAADVLVAGRSAMRRLGDASRWRAVLDPIAIVDAASTLERHDEPALPRPTPSDPAYVLFTSGSTGAPKGIVHTHSSAMSYARNAVSAHDLGPSDRLAGLPPLHFDMSTLELYAAPLAGASVTPVSDATLRFPADVVAHCARFETTVWYAVPTLLCSLVDRGGLACTPLPSLRHVVYAGEPFPPEMLERFSSAVGPLVSIDNAYGPTETNVVSVHRLEAERAPGSPVPIGHPWPGSVFRIDDGELWVASEGLMDGYLNRPDLTAERVVIEDGVRWYRTGDKIDMGPSGAVYRGRIDAQVKVRGVRLELEAIEAVLESHQGVATAIAAAVPAEQPQRIEALIVMASGYSAPEHTDLQRFAGQRLPRAGIPESFEFTESLPTTRSGKVDRMRARAELAASRSEQRGDAG